MTQNIIFFDPLASHSVLGLIFVFSIIFLFASFVRGLPGWPWRSLAVICVLVFLGNPSLRIEKRNLEPDVVIIVLDNTMSQSLKNRPEQNMRALEHLTKELASRPNTETRTIELSDAAGDKGSLLMSAVASAISKEAKDRLAGVIIISDGQIHDADLAPIMDVPLHLLLTGQPEDWDRRLVVKDAPGFAILGEPAILSIMLQDQGSAPQTSFAEFFLSVDDGPNLKYEIPVNQFVEVEVPLLHGGINVLQFSTPEISGELTGKNNSAVVRINAVRDRLRVLLVSGIPHPGERTWRNLLKSDSSVDLVHFTILRPPEKRDDVPVAELSLIAFPTRELFLEKIDEFDLIIFDRYKRRGLLPASYFESISNYVRKGGAVLVAAGPDYAGVNSLYRSPLGSILPGRPTSRVFEEPILPVVTDLGYKHPISEGLESFASDQGWGRWLRQIELEATSGNVLLTGKRERPLLLVDRVGNGRVALLASDHAWLWDRGFEGGGPQAELLRRIAHWLMKEPDLEEESLFVTPTENGLRVTRRTIKKESISDLEVVAPNGDLNYLRFDKKAPGRYETLIIGDQEGLYRLKSNDLEVVAAMGPIAPRELSQTIASVDAFKPTLAKTGGGSKLIYLGLPKLRNIRSGRAAYGRNWVGLISRNIQSTQGVELKQLLPSWIYLILALSSLLIGWLREGR